MSGLQHCPNSPSPHPHVAHVPCSRGVSTSREARATTGPEESSCPTRTVLDPTSPVPWVTGAQQTVAHSQGLS